MWFMKYLSIILFVVYLSACKKEKKNNIVCTGEAKAALNVKVSSPEGKTIYIDSLKVIAIDAAFSETLAVVNADEFMFAGAYERAGNYQVTVTHPGMSMVTLKDVKVTKDDCHVIPRNLEVMIGMK